MLLQILRIVYCKWCSKYTRVPFIFSQDSIYCRTCVAKCCFECSNVMELGLLDELKELYHDYNAELNEEERVTFQDGFRSLDFFVRTGHYQCNECKMIKHNVRSKKKELKFFTREIDPDRV